jgi:AcrR family transcriptional regulator
MTWSQNHFMSIESIKTLRKSAKREWILAKATEVFFEKGFEAVSMEEIAQRAEVSKGSLYTYFKSKAELYMAIQLEGLNLLNQRMSAIFTSNFNGLKMLAQLGNHYIEFIHSNKGYFDAMNYFKDRNTFENVKDYTLIQACQTNGLTAFNFLVRAIQIGIQDGSIRKDVNPQSMALQIWAGTSGLSDFFYQTNNMEHVLNKSITGEEWTMAKAFSDFMGTIRRAIAS